MPIWIAWKYRGEGIQVALIVPEFDYPGQYRLRCADDTILISKTPLQHSCAERHSYESVFSRTPTILKILSHSCLKFIFLDHSTTVWLFPISETTNSKSVLSLLQT